MADEILSVVLLLIDKSSLIPQKCIFKLRN